HLFMAIGLGVLSAPGHGAQANFTYFEVGMGKGGIVHLIRKLMVFLVQNFNKYKGTRRKDLVKLLPLWRSGGRAYLQKNWAMVAVPCFRQNHRSFQPVLKGMGNHSIIQTPSFVVCTGICPIRPPGIIIRILVKMPKTIDKTVLQKITDPFPFYGQESRYVGISDRIMDIYRRMTNIVIATDDQVGPFL